MAYCFAAACCCWLASHGQLSHAMPKSPEDGRASMGGSACDGGVVQGLSCGSDGGGLGLRRRVCVAPAVGVGGVQGTTEHDTHRSPSTRVYNCTQSRQSDVRDRIGQFWWGRVQHFCAARPGPAPRPPMPCGFHTECRRQYSLHDVNASAATWDASDAGAAARLRARHEEARAACSSAAARGRVSSAERHGLSTLTLDNGLQATGGWCLDVSSRAHDQYSTAKLAGGRSYFLPKPYLAADSTVVDFLSRLLKRCEDDACASWRSRSLNDFGAGIGGYGRALLAVDSRFRWSGYDGAGNIEEASNGFVRYFDLTTPLSLPRADYVMSLEVGEHVPRDKEMMVVRNLHAHNCKGIILSWAPPGKTGVGHVNTHSDKYLQGLFAELGYRVNRPVTRALRQNRTRAAFAAAFRGRPFVGVMRSAAGAMQDRWTQKAVRTRNVSQAWWWIHAMMLERIEPLSGLGCT